MQTPDSTYPVSHWLTERQPYATHPLPAEADVLVLGGGLVGVSIALALAEAGRPPVILEREYLAAGASGRNGGLLLPGTAELYPRLVQRWGRDKARSLWALAEHGAHQLVTWIGHYGIDCDWRPEGGLHVATSEAEADRLAETAAWLIEDGFGASWVDTDELARWIGPGDGLTVPSTFRGAVLHPAGGPLHSGRMVTGLANAATSMGARIVEGCSVSGVESSGDSVIVTAVQDGIPVTLRAGTVIVAANAWAASILPPLGRVITPIRGQVLCSQPLPTQCFTGAWSLNDGFEYFQQLPDGRLVLGGMRWTAPDLEVGYDRPELNDDLQERLVDWFAEAFPGIGPLEVERRWAGIMAFTPDRLPLIGRFGSLTQAVDVVEAAGAVVESGRLWVAAGFNGHGLPFAPLAAELIVAGLAGRPLPDGAEAFDPRRWDF